MIVNSTQSPIDESLKENLDSYVYNELLDCIDKIEFIKNLISPNRSRACDLTRWDNPNISNRKKDDNGKIHVNLTDPHILEDMDFFRQAAINFEENGRYTDYHPSKHPNSPFKKFWREEKRRCIEGLVRPSDGEWITGYNYFYWNYFPIMIAESVSDDVESSSIEADRIKGFPKVWDMDYLYFHYLAQCKSEGKYGVVLKTRGRGYSFKNASILSCIYQFFADAKAWAFASDKGDLTDDGLLSKTWDNLDFINEHTAWFKKRHEKDTDMHKRSSYKDLNRNVYKGYKSEILGLTTANRPEKARGKRGKAILIEEAGRYLHLLKVWAIARPSMEQGPLVFGLMVAYGTGGTVGAAFEGLESLFYQCKAYRVKSLPNVFDKLQSKSTCAFYCGEYMNRELCYDENGNSDVVKALIATFESRLEVLNESPDPRVIMQEKADRSITPQEAVMRVEGNLFPVPDLKDYLAEISPNLRSFVSPHYIGRLSVKNGTVDWAPSEKEPIRTFPLSSQKDKTGAIEIFKQPVKKNSNEAPAFRYIIGVDPYDDDSGTSLGSAFVFDLWTDRIVAEYTGRPKFANDFYEICRRLSIYYNALINYENKNKGLFGYFNQKHSLHLLADNPKFLTDTDTTQANQSYGNKRKGTAPTKEVNALGRRLQRDWMLSTNPEDENQLMMHTIRSVAYIKELIAWHEDGNYDRVSAMNMVMIQREEMLKYGDTMKDETVTKTLADDDFWKKN